MKEEYMSLIIEYIDGTLTAEREQEFRQYVKEGHIVMEEIEALEAMQARIKEAPAVVPGESLNAGFYAMLAKAKKAEQKTAERSGSFRQLGHLFFSTLYGRLAFGIGILLVGVLAGSVLDKGKYEQQLTALNVRMSEMQEMMMVSMLQEESVADRLKGVQMSNEFTAASEKVTNALFMVLNNDESTNVRIAALNALAAYANDPFIREGIIHSIPQQQSPLMQVALAELMVELQEKNSIEQFKKLLKNENTPDEVKTTLQESIEQIM